MVESDKLVKTAAQTADDKKAEDILVLNVREPLVITSYFLIMSGRSTRQVKELARSIRDKMSELRVKPIGAEGEEDGRWVLLDFGDLVVHIFTAEERGFYELERLWSDAPEVEWKKLKEV
ncbi:MAG: ribosome silencing factor [Terriglobia bacterium]